MTIAQQIAVGLAVVAGHNWPVFLRFNGGRGIGTALGLIVAFPVLNGYPAWDIAVFVGIIVLGIVLLRSTPLPVLIGLAALPAISHVLGEPAEIGYGFMALLAIVIIKRLTANRPVGQTRSKWLVLLNRFLFDRDIRDRKAWMYRTPTGKSKPGQGQH
jgi:glycerol-3-phosphate acyltransferase PlsY